MKRLNICIVMSLPFPPEEGIGNYVYGLSTKLVEKGHKVTVITRGSRNKKQKEIIGNIEVIRAPFIPIYPFYMYLHGIFVNRIFKSLEPKTDIVHIHSPLTPVIKTKLPVITTVHTPMLTDARYVSVKSFHSLLTKISARFVSYPLEMKLLHASDMVTTVTKTIAQELKEYRGNPDEVVVTGNGVDEKFFMPAQNKVEDDSKYIMYAGHMSREKGLFDLVECGKYICRERVDVSFIFAGKGCDLNKLKQKTEKLGLQDRFTFLGQVDRKRLVSLYQNATIFVLPSYHEGLPTVLLEAMSCGLPVLATDVRGNLDIISNGENGILIHPKAPKKMAAAISMLLEDKKLRKKLAENARKTIEQKFTWDIICDNILNCYTQILENTKRL